ncbi:hypothetical protein HDV06_000015 [Boothiomyces sp. JEL0866]|nr:hypothetical protein HDV06_000015 [Boothiomyces sp. JEL0866]
MAMIQLCVRQSPFKGREAGLKKPYIQSYLYPSLILQLEFNFSTTLEQLQKYNFVCSLSIYTPDKQEMVSTIQNTFYSRTPYTQNFTGTIVKPGKVLLDLVDKKPKIFFLFDDLNIKLRNYNFICHLVLVSPENEHCGTLENSFYSRTPYTQNFSGEMVKSGVVLHDKENGKHKIFFLFEDLNIKVVGDYKFSCVAIDTERGLFSEPIDTQPFSVVFRTDFVKANIRTVLSKSFDAQLEQAGGI